MDRTVYNRGRPLDAAARRALPPAQPPLFSSRSIRLSSGYLSTLLYTIIAIIFSIILDKCCPRRLSTEDSRARTRPRRGMLPAPVGIFRNQPIELALRAAAGLLNIQPREFPLPHGKPAVDEGGLGDIARAARDRLAVRQA